ncbi:chromosome condensation complex Condensin, subunit G [Entomophthora muscae]|uniref:Chromosome condensation complex Condensin, subunit G n=1 Tax=Entomophthora muscae TaxID=34485 RepID=A0ACC2TK18_9FUNG|nr:chromosome condensation complex Condensin, subunit G [Entomophthora muscae]
MSLSLHLNRTSKRTLIFGKPLNSLVCGSIISNLKDKFWENLSIESAFLARILITYVQSEEDLDKLDELLPSASAMAQLIKEQSNLLEITLLHDFSDEAGRRKVFDILRKLFVKIDANEDQIKVMVLIIRKLSNDELDFTRTMVEIQSDILEEVNSDFQAVSFQDIENDLEIEEKKDQHRDFLNAAYKCLMASKHMLRLCEMTIEKNVILSGVLNDLIYPASKCNIDVLNAAGTECLGLCCMLDKKLAASNFQHFTYLIKDEDDEIRLTTLKIVLDLCAIYGVSPSPFAASTAKIYEFFKTCMKSSDKEFLATASQGIAKLFLAGTLDDPEILGRLIQLYFIPATADNAKLRQGLHYFLEAYSHFSPSNRFVIAKAFTPSLIRLVAVHKKFGAKFPMTKPLQIGLQLADWTSPLKSGNELSDNVHTSIAIELLKEAFTADETICKLIFQILPKLAIDTFTSPTKLLCLSKLLDGFKEKCQYPDVGSRNTATKFSASIHKQMKEHCLDSEIEADTPQDPEPVDPEVAEVDEFLLSVDQDLASKRPGSKRSAPSKRRKVKREVSETSDEDASYAP